MRFYKMNFMCNKNHFLVIENNLKRINNIKFYNNYHNEMIKTNLLRNTNNKFSDTNNGNLDYNSFNIGRIKRNSDNNRIQSKSFHDYKKSKLEENDIKILQETESKNKLIEDRDKKEKLTMSNIGNELKNNRHENEHKFSNNIECEDKLDDKNKNKKTIKNVKIVPDSYIKSIEQLNQLQSNAKSLKESVKRRYDYVATKSKEIHQTLSYLNRLNVTIDDLKKLNVIHISGTKGKGSTCAYCESILRSHGYSTGFFSSPHLMEVRERIKINGQPISYDKFTNYFWHVYNNLYEKRTNSDDMPAYFKFLTIMSFYIFIKEKLDVCIMEVGIGGLYDNTNIVPNTSIVGITSLGYDHTACLGNTIEEITSHKAGIMKPNCIAVTSLNQLNNCKPVLINKAKETHCLLLEAPNILNYKWNNFEMKEHWKNTFQSINISLAIQLAYLFMYRMNKSNELKNIIDKFFKDLNIYIDQTGQIIRLPSSNSSLIVGPNFNIDKKTYDGIKSCEWPGRMQIISKNNYKYYLDGAHTTDSIKLCSKWFQKKSKEEEIKANEIKLENNIINDEMNKQFEKFNENERNIKDITNSHNEIIEHTENQSKSRVKRILIFNLTGERDPKLLLPLLMECNFDYILITPNVIDNRSPDIKYAGSTTNSNTISNHIRTQETTNKISKNFMDEFKIDKMNPLVKSDNPILDDMKTNTKTYQMSVDSHNLTNNFEDKKNSIDHIVSIARRLNKRQHCKILSLNNVLETYSFANQLDPMYEYHVLVTGSLHLVGAVLNVLSSHD